MSLEEAEKEMGGKVFSLSELESLLSEDGVLVASKHCQQIASDENTRFLLVRDLKRTIQQAQNTEVKKEASCSPAKITKLDFLLNNQPSTSSGVVSRNSPEVSDSPEQMGDEFDLELQQAIQMSLQQNTIKLNTNQKKLYSNAVRNDAVRGFILEYGGMNDEEINEMLENTQHENKPSGIDLFGQKFVHNDSYILHGTPNKKSEELPVESKVTETQDIEEVGIISDSDDSDLEEVVEKKIVISLQQDVVETYKKEDDIFADIFEEKNDEELVLSDSTVIYDPYETEESFSKISNISRKESIDHETGEIEQSQENKDERTIFGSVDLSNSQEKSDDPLKTPPEIPIEEKTNFLLKEQSKLDALLSSLKQQKDEICFKSLPKVSTAPDFFDLDDDIELEAKILNEANGIDNLSETIEPDDNYLAQANEALEISSDDESLPAKTPTKLLTNKFLQQTPPKSLISEDVPKLPSPFFVNRTPKSNKKTENCTETNSNKAVKSLFPEIQEIPDSPVKLSAEQVLQAAADSMRKTTTTTELKDMASKLMVEQKDLLRERNKQDRMGLSITEQMSNDCKDLLK